MNEYQPDMVIPPGEILEELLEERGIALDSFADHLYISLDTLRGILKGEVVIEMVLAEQLATLLGTPAYIWLEGEKRYREHLAQKSAVSGD